MEMRVGVFSGVMVNENICTSRIKKGGRRVFINAFIGCLYATMRG